MDINVAICDDENVICNKIKENLLAIRPNYNVTIYHSGQELLDAQEIYDLIFLDIEMPEMNGMETAESLRKNNNDEYIIFLTSHTEFMPEAFKVKAFRFLNKPIEIEKFEEAVKEAEKEILNSVKIAIVVKGETKFVRIKDIVYFEAFGDGTYIHMKNEVWESNKPLKYWNEQMGNEHFFQTHKSYIVALRHINKVEENKVKFDCIGDTVLVSRRKNTQLKETLFAYVKKNSRFI